MTETIDRLIQARFDAVANPRDGRDWADVLARMQSAERTSQRRIPTRIALAAAVVILAVAVTAVAFGWPRTFVDFSTAPPAPESVKEFFSSHNTRIPGGVSPWESLGEPRRIMSANFDADHIDGGHPTLHTLYAAPRTSGGFCYLWTDYGGSCADAESTAEAKTDPAARPLGVEWLANDYAGFVDGWVRTDAKTVEARFADGTTAPIPVTWVSAPIGAGFFAYVVPPVHQTSTDAVTSVVALDADGNAVGRQDIPVTKPLDEDVMQTLPDGTKYSLPRRAQASRAREIAEGSHFYLWVMPRTGGGYCFLYGTGAGGGGGCTSPYWLARLPAVNGSVVGGTDSPLYFAQVKPSIATIELRYGNGEGELLTPIDGFVLHPIAPGRLIAAVGRDRRGKAIFTQHYPPPRYHAVLVP